MLKEFLQDRKWESALNLVSRYPRIKTNLYIQSLLYRLLDQYDLEKKLIKQSLITHPSWDYLREREKWHTLSMFEKCEARPPIHLKRNPDLVPNNKILKKTCFVTISSASAFNYLVQLLESIKNSRHNDLPICILSTGKIDGFTDQQKKYLNDNFNIYAIKDIDEKDISVQNTAPEKRLYGSVSLPYIDLYFPDFQYFFYIEHDCWINDDRILDEVIYFAEKYNFSIRSHHIGMFCVPKDFFSTWRKNLPPISFIQNNFEGHNKVLIEYIDKSLVKLVSKLGGQFFTSETFIDVYNLNDLYFPVLKNNELVEPMSTKKIGIMHLQSMKELWFVPTTYIANITQSLLKAIKYHTLYSKLSSSHPLLPKNILQKIKNYKEVINANNLLEISLQYRTWPWQEKVDIENKLLTLP